MPLTRFMGLRPERFGDGEIRFHLPLQNNLNDKGTAFGGSTSAAMILAGWSLLHLSLQEQGIDADVVIYRNSSQWHRPLTTDATVVARFQSSTVSEVASRNRWGQRRQRVSCAIRILDAEGREHSEMVADYVIMPARDKTRHAHQEAS